MHFTCHLVLCFILWVTIIELDQTYSLDNSTSVNNSEVDKWNWPGGNFSFGATNSTPVLR